MAMEISGKITKFLKEQTGSGRNGTWVKQEFVIETNEQYPKSVCISAWGDKVDEIRKFNPGDQVKLSVNIESREYNERWYTDVRVWKIEREGADGGGRSNDRGTSGNGGGQSGSYSSSADDLGPEPYTSSSSDDDDLPF
jgi:hypothetical protein